MSIAHLMDAVQRSASESAEALSETLYELITSTRDLFDCEKNEPTSVALPRILESDEFRPLRARISTALALGARSWTIPPDDDRANLTAANLFRQFSSPQVAIGIASRISGTNSMTTRRNSRYDDLLLDAMLRSAIDVTVRNRIIDLINSDSFRAYSIVVFLRLVRIDISAIPLIIDSVLSTAEEVISFGGKLSYLVGFDAHLTLPDVQGLLRVLNETQAARFFAAFIVHSERYRLAFPDKIPETSIIDGQAATDYVLFGDEREDPEYEICDSKSGICVRVLDSRVIVEGGRIAFDRRREELIEPLVELGLETRSLETAFG